MNFNDRFAHLEELRTTFLSLDRSNDGLLTIDEIREGLTRVMGHVRGNLREFEKIMAALDSNNNQVIDYSEFLTAACGKMEVVTN